MVGRLISGKFRWSMLVRFTVVAVVVGAVAAQAQPAASAPNGPGQPGSANPTQSPYYKPDLHISAAEFKDIGGSWFFTPGTYLVFTVKNSGTAKAGGFRVAVRDGNGAVVQWFVLTDGLAAGASRTFYHQLPPFDCGAAHTRIVEADATKLVAESNESNNTATRTHIYPPC